jgi:hypothetical protein
MTQVSTIAVGQEFADFARDGDFAHWNRYAAVNDEFYDIHMLDEAAIAAGFHTAFGMGNLTRSYMHIALHQWFGDEAGIAALGVQYRHAVFRGSEVHIRGRVTAVRHGPPLEVDLDVWAENHEGHQLAPGTATVVIPTPPDSQARADA